MDSIPRPLKPFSSPSSSSSSSSSSKLPIKRSSFDLLDSPSASFHPHALPITTLHSDSKPSPFKFQRIWTESDEILFIQGLLDSSSRGLSFPRDMPAFYRDFSPNLSHCYTKSQFSEKLRRLRRKFRITSARLSRGVVPSRLSPHDRTLFEISKKLWGAELPAISPSTAINQIDSETGANISRDYSERIKLVGVKVTFSPVLPVSLPSFSERNSRSIEPIDSNEGNEGKTSVDHKENSDLFEAKKGELEEAKSVVAKSVREVVDESLKEVERIHEREKLRALSDSNFERRYMMQRVAEVDVFARRLRLVLENSVNKLS